MTDEIIDESTDAVEPIIEQKPEKMIPVSEASRNIAGAKKKAYEKAKAEYENRIRDLEERLNINNPSDQAAETAAPQIQQPVPQQDFSKESLRKEIDASLQELKAKQEQELREKEAHRILTELATKVEDAHKRIPDFKDVVSTFNFEQTPELLEASNLFDNSGDILYDLAKNKGKIGALLALGQRDPRAMVSEMRQLSESIKKNQAAKDLKFPREPMQSLTSSNLGSDSGELSHAEILRRAKAKYRG